MRIYDYKAFDWNRVIAPYGNLGGVNPQVAADLCDEWGVPWWSSSWPYSGGIKAFCMDDELWNRIRNMAKGSQT